MWKLSRDLELLLIAVIMVCIIRLFSVDMAITSYWMGCCVCVYTYTHKSHSI